MMIKFNLKKHHLAGVCSGGEGIQDAAVLARRFNTSANKINKIAACAIQHLRHPRRASRLSEFLT